ncbi:hypothetical protein DICPUDRAFT_156766 [Dictyostelium purpureum]|uniref:BTB domain-containing protein n=1 Tax=Dictyostelium purpureum TaxID=5786 RepID=F0ZXD7_DICPU|nr:uncharacterized protein DICPUDRAFT_156766 [Dictyostelium purpureum]EGC31407.1 hypothetical protein DICPUDRAFT_156766 [Dictyostelium purpureum]|eukprot:XP_003292077.1 hypothetical protein DICPUDRAFT_156766 [Dictyostelium purpureum]
MKEEEINKENEEFSSSLGNSNSSSNGIDGKNFEFLKQLIINEINEKTKIYSPSTSPKDSLLIKEQNEIKEGVTQKDFLPKINNNHTSSSDGNCNKKIIKLNIGGTIYYTTLTTLLSDSNSMFSLMFSGRFNIEREEEDGSIFIDRDGKYFHYILNWLRSHFIPFISDPVERECVLNEAFYYQITPLIEHIQQQVQNQSLPDPNKYTKKEIIQLVNMTHSQQPIQIPSSNLAGLDLSGLNLSGVNLRFSNLEGSSLRYCNLEGANLEGANLKSCDLRYSNLCSANLQKAQLQNSLLQYSRFHGSNLSDAELCDASLQNADFQNSFLSGANLHGANLIDTNLNGAKLQGTSFSKVIGIEKTKGLPKSRFIS